MIKIQFLEFSGLELWLWTYYGKTQFHIITSCTNNNIDLSPCVHITYLVGLWHFYCIPTLSRWQNLRLWFSFIFAFAVVLKIQKAIDCSFISSYNFVVLCHVVDRRWHFQPSTFNKRCPPITTMSTWWYSKVLLLNTLNKCHISIQYGFILIYKHCGLLCRYVLMLISM